MGGDKGQLRVAGRFPEVGAIFMCNRATKKECFRRKLFGLPSGKADFVGHVKVGMILFLFEYERRELHGVFRACSDGAIDIVPHAYGDSGMQFSAQVRFTTILRCSPLSEDEFSGAIRENYFSPKKFNFGLSERQVEKLLQLFSSRKIQRQLHHRQSPQNDVRRSSPANYVSSHPEGAIDGGYRSLGRERYEQNAVSGSGSLRSPEYSENTTNFIRRAVDDASITIGNSRRLNDRSHVPVTPTEDVGDLIVSNNVALERPVHRDNWQSTLGDSRNKINADFVHGLDGGSRYSEHILATDRRRGSRTAGYHPLLSSEQQPGVSQYPSPPVHGSNSTNETNYLVGDDRQHISTDRRTGFRAPGYDPPVSCEQQPGVPQYPSPPVHGSNSIYETNYLVGDDLRHISADRRMGSSAPGYDPPVPSEQQPGVPHYPNPPEYDLQYIPMDRRTVSIAPGYDPPRSSEQQHGVSQYPNPPVYGRNSFLETNSLVGDDLQRTSSIMHNSSTEPSYSHLMSYSALSVLESLPRPSLILDGPHPAPSSRPGTGNISTQPYNPEAPSFDTNHTSPFLRVSSSSLDESLPALNRAVSFPSYENELPRPYRQVRDDSRLLPRYAQSNLSNDSNEASCRSNMLYRSSLSRESFPRPSLPPLQLPSERQRGRTTTIDDRSLLAPRINTPSVSGRSHLVTTSLEGNIPQYRRAHDAVPCSGNSIPNSEQTQDSRRTDYGAYSPVDLYSGQDSERRNSDQQNRRKRSVFDRMVFPTTQEREQEDSATNSVGDDDDDDNQDDFSVSEIMTSLRQSSYRWLNEKTPAKFLNEIRNSGFQYQVGNKKIQIMTPETKSADDHLAVGVPVEDYCDALTTNEESPPFVDFKRRSSTMRKAHQVDAAKPTGNDNVLSAENKPSKRRKLIRPKFGDET